MNDLHERPIVLGVCGGIAAYKAADLCSKLAQAGATVRVVMTQHALEFITPVTFQALSGQPVYTATFAAPETYGMGHLSLAGSAAAMVVAPATANLLGKAAAGIADDLLTTTLLSVTCPVLLAPAMNPAMWANPLTQRNVATLRDAGHHVIGPDSGWVACRDVGLGRMSEPAAIVTVLRRLLWRERDLVGRTVLVTAGPTREPMDAVRFLSNPSSGKQGYAVAEAALMRGARVVLVSGPVELPPPPEVELVSVTTAAEMLEAVVRHADAADIVVG
ncbi:MAG: bifunctional phosphopantothenoylcysteine decarboxylase/phosphopantothenate--cysteine ligase CoaBC, partial [Armatimonadetes bacterium]|nr:bifunctional phosphopantothenoylcysteine decarboxylase/phosphopantothenate--cysteine ligase CoaBC [Armatimonadota bacterium]